MSARGDAADNDAPIDDLIPVTPITTVTDSLPIWWGVPLFPPSLHEEVTLTNNVRDHNGEETDFCTTTTSRASLAYQEPYSGRRDSQPA